MSYEGLLEAAKEALEFIEKRSEGVALDVKDSLRLAIRDAEKTPPWLGDADHPVATRRFVAAVAAANGTQLEKLEAMVAGGYTIEGHSQHTKFVEQQRDELLASMEAVTAQMFTSYKARNGRCCYIEDDSGELCYIVPHEPIFSVQAVIASVKDAV